MSAPTRALEELLDGYRAYRSAHFGDGSRVRETWTCAESSTRSRGMDRNLAPWSCRAATRADPALVFDAREPGAIFVVRTWRISCHRSRGWGAARGGDARGAGIAVTRLRVPLVVVMGHTRCGGVAASLQKYDDGPECDPHAFEVNEATGGVHRELGRARGETTRRTRTRRRGGVRCPRARARALERENVKQSVKNVETFPFVASRVASGDLVVAGAVFDVADGRCGRSTTIRGVYARRRRRLVVSDVDDHARRRPSLASRSTTRDSSRVL